MKGSAGSSNGSLQRRILSNKYQEVKKMDDIIHKVDLDYLKVRFEDSIIAELPGDILVIDFGGDRKDTSAHIFQSEAYMVYFCRKGAFDIEVNMELIHIGENALLVNKPGNIIKICDENIQDSGFLLLVLSRDFFAGINVDYNRLFNESIGILTKPCQFLSREDIMCLGQFFKAGASVLTSDYDGKREILGELIGSAAYLLSSIWSKRILGNENKNDNSTRETAIFDEFLKLVTEFHLMHKDVGFYADKLFLTPKYLSKIIKEVSGLSAPDWIEKMTIMEAKSLLKYSDLTVAEIVWKLRFSSPSVFYKYFKRKTGMTPLEFRNEQHV